jgi:RNA polymerase sigma-70 factor (ECF subfamily)
LDRDERALVGRCLQGDQLAWTALVNRYSQLVGTVIWRATADHDVVEDLAQETFLRVCRGLPYFDARAKLSTWIFTIAHRVSVDYVRDAGRWREVSRTLDEDRHEQRLRHVARDPDPEAAASLNELHQVVREQLAHLPDKYRLPLLYAAIDGLDQRTIAAMLRLPIGTVKTLVFRAKGLLKERIAAALEARCRS